MHQQTLFGDFDFSSGWVDSVTPELASEILARTKRVESARDAAIRESRERQALAGAAPSLIEDDFLSALDGPGPAAGRLAAGNGAAGDGQSAPVDPAAVVQATPHAPQGDDHDAAPASSSSPDPEATGLRPAPGNEPAANRPAVNPPAAGPGTAPAAGPQPWVASVDVLGDEGFDVDAAPSVEADGPAAGVAGLASDVADGEAGSEQVLSADQRVAIDDLPDEVREDIEQSRQALVQEAQEAAKTVYIPVEDFTLDAEILAEDRSPKQKALDNIEAIKTAKMVMMAGRAATREEKAVLAKYVGWGGLQYAFYDLEGKTERGWEGVARQLQDVLSAKEYARARSTILDAHYTSADVVQSIWAGVQRMGFKGGSMMEPAGGSGNFLGLQPQALAEKSQRFMVEIDPTTANIAKLLYPQAFVANSGLESFSTGGAKFDLFIGNPPFGDIRLIDARGGADETVSNLTTRLATSTHSYFFGRAAEGLRPGGVSAMVVSRYLLDGSTVDAVDFRAALAQQMELVDAVRLPDTAFKQNAGTDVVTDIIFLQKRTTPISDEEARALPWVDVVDIDNPDASAVEQYPTVRINQWYQQHPEKVIGQLIAGRGMYRDGELMVKPTADWKDRLAQAMQALPRDIMPSAVSAIELPSSAESDSVVPPSGLLPGQMFLWGKSDGTYAVRRKSALAAFGANTSEAVTFDNVLAEKRVVDMLLIHETLVSLMRAQVSEDYTDGEIESLRKDLNERYDTFQSQFGYMKRAVNRRAVRSDPCWTLLSSLEVDYDDGVSDTVAKKTQSTPRAPSAKKADVFTKRTQWPIKRVEHVETAKDAMMVSLSETAGIDPTRMMQLTGRDWWSLRDEIGDLMLYDPMSQRWVERDALLSGDVLTKYQTVQTLLQSKPSGVGDVDEVGEDGGRLRAEMERSLQLLGEAAPARKSASEIVVLPGASWVPMHIMQEFAQEICGGMARIEYSEQSGKWTIGGSRYGGEPAYSTQRMTAVDIMKSVWNGKSPVVRDALPDGGSVVNVEQTALAKQKAEKLIERWLEFTSESAERSAELADAWNNVFNRTVARKFDGSHLKFEGSSDSIRLRPHQANAVWRSVMQKATLFDHVVGAGKTYAMIASVMESRRMGLTKKAMIAVPNNVVGQWRDAFGAMYPASKILVAEADDMSAGNRQQFLAKAAFGDWDAIIIPHTSFGLIPPDPDHEMRYVDEQIAMLKADLLASKENATRKEIEKAVKRLEQRVRSIAQTRKDDGIHFGMLGVDLLAVDEADLFKNVSYTTQLSVSGLGNPAGSGRANDMMLKSSYVLDAGGKFLTATGTPISNSVAEMYILQRYNDLDGLKAQRLYSFDAWQRSYAQVTSDFAFTLTGKFKEKTVLSRFVNLDGLLASYRSFADVITRTDMNRLMAEAGLPPVDIPEMRGGKPMVHVSPMSAAQRSLMGEQVGMTDNGHPIYSKGSILWRLDNLPKKRKPEKGDDNILVVINDIRKVGLDARAYVPGADRAEHGKINDCASNIFDSWERFKDDRGTQLVFLDFCTPQNGQEASKILDLVQRSESDDANVAEAAEDALAKYSQSEIDAVLHGATFDAYSALRGELVQRGIPSEQIAFIHDYSTPAKRDKLFAAVNAGEIRVLVGSTSKMGAGTNVQQRITDLHHLDAPYRPRDLEQRNGRGLRQGNELLKQYGRDNFAVGVHYYVTEDSGDAGLWQILQTKLEFIEQVRTGCVGGVLENPEASAIDPARVKAMASGNEILMDEVKLKDDVQKAHNLILAVKQDYAVWESRLSNAKAALGYSQRAQPSMMELQAKARAALSSVFERTEAIRAEVEQSQAQGKKHPLKDVVDVASKIPAYVFKPAKGDARAASLADVGSVCSVMAMKIAGMSGAREDIHVGDLNGVGIYMNARNDYSTYPPAVRVHVGVGLDSSSEGDPAIEWHAGEVNVSGSEAAPAIGRAAWTVLSKRLQTVGDENANRISFREKEVEHMEASRPNTDTAQAIERLNVLRERHEEAVLALRLGYRKWEDFERDAPLREAAARALEEGQPQGGVDPAAADEASAPEHVG